jgi:hypothetical protein
VIFELIDVFCFAVANYGDEVMTDELRGMYVCECVCVCVCASVVYYYLSTPPHSHTHAHPELFGVTLQKVRDAAGPDWNQLRGAVHTDVMEYLHQHYGI